MAIYIPLSLLSVWEIAHRWHDVDPDEQQSENLPRAVRERARQLLHALTYGLHAYDVHGDPLADEEIWFTGVRKSKFGKALERHLHQGNYDREFLRSVFILRKEFERWCWRVDEQLPEFWFPYEVDRSKSDSASTATESAAQAVVPKSASSVAKQAARKRHEPGNQVKREFCAFWDRSGGKYKSRAEAARRFYESLPKEKKVLAPTNAIRTLTAALSEHLRGKSSS
jgi:hypothetical protein